MVGVISWNTLMIMKNISILIVGVGLGALGTILFIGYMLHRIRRVEDMEHASAVRIQYGPNESHFLINPQTTHEGVETLLLIVYMYFHKGKSISQKNSKRAQRTAGGLFVIVCVALVILTVLSFAISTPQ